MTKEIKHLIELKEKRKIGDAGEDADYATDWRHHAGRPDIRNMTDCQQ